MHESLQLLTADRDEQLFFVIGAVTQQDHVLEQRLEFQPAKCSLVGIIGCHADTHHLLVHLEQYGHRLPAHFHSPPPTVFRLPGLPDMGYRASHYGERLSIRPGGKPTTFALLVLACVGALLYPFAGFRRGML